MKRFLIVATLFGSLSGCASSNYVPESVRTTQAMTDMDGRPIYPGPSSSLGVGIGIGSWWHRGGVGVGFGTGW
jgi:hypothetical protein